MFRTNTLFRRLFWTLCFRYFSKNLVYCRTFIDNSTSESACNRLCAYHWSTRSIVIIYNHTVPRCPNINLYYNYTAGPTHEMIFFHSKQWHVSYKREVHNSLIKSLVLISLLILSSCTHMNLTLKTSIDHTIIVQSSGFLYSAQSICSWENSVTKMECSGDF